MALNISFFKTPKHKVFTYRPIFYDPEKERLEERRKARDAAREAEGVEGSEVTERRQLDYPGKNIRGSFQKSLYENRRHVATNSFTRIVVILSILLLFILIFYFSDGLAMLFSTLSNPHTP